MVGKSKYNAFRGIKDRFWCKFQNWKNNFLSKVGKEVRIKSVLQVIPTYTMLVFMLPQNLCKDITTLLAKFWWETNHKKRGTHWSK